MDDLSASKLIDGHTIQHQSEDLRKGKSVFFRYTLGSTEAVMECLKLWLTYVDYLMQLRFVRPRYGIATNEIWNYTNEKW